MADLLITRSITVNGVPTNADTVPVLRDPTLSYGLRRDDDQSVVVAAGVPLTNVATGRYQMTVNGLVAGVAYTYYIETTVGGNTSRQEKHYAPPAATPLPSYLTVAEAQAIADGLFGLIAWGAEEDEAIRLKALQTATARVDASRRWQGRKADVGDQGSEVSQVLEFPRFDRDLLIDFDPTDPHSGVPIVPIAIKQAVLYEADSLLSGERRDRLHARHDGVASQSIGSAAETYRPLVAGDGTPILCVEADTLCGRYRLRSGAMR